MLWPILLLSCLTLNLISGKYETIMRTKTIITDSDIDLNFMFFT
jgi:hypothetical protein